MTKKKQEHLNKLMKMFNTDEIIELDKTTIQEYGVRLEATIEEDEEDMMLITAYYKKYLNCDYETKQFFWIRDEYDMLSTLNVVRECCFLMGDKVNA